MIKVTDKTENRKVTFADLLVGDVYYDRDGTVCIKTRLTWTDDNFNCIHLNYANTWSAGHEKASAPVFPVEADLVIK